MKVKFFVAFFLFSLYNCSIIFAQNVDQTLSELISVEEFNSLPEEIQLELKKIGYYDNTYAYNTIQKNAIIKDTNRDILHTGKLHEKVEKGIQKPFDLLKTLNQQNSSYYLEKLDSIVDYEAILSPAYDSLEVQNIKRKLDQNGYPSESITQVFDSISNSLVNTQKNEYNFDSEGNILKQMTYDWTGEVWAISGKIETEYNSNGLITLRESYNWGGNSWLKLTKYEYEYDNNGQQLLYASYRVDEYNEWKDYLRTDYSYHDNGERATSDLYLNWNAVDSVWMVEGRSEYDETGQIILSTRKQYDISTGAMEFSYKTEYEYLEDGSTVETRFGWNSDTQEFFQQYQNRYKFERTYENDNMTQEIKLNFVYDNWVYDYKKNYEYDQWGNQILYEVYDPYWGDNGELKERTIRAFTETGRQIKYERYYWEFSEEYGYNRQIGLQFYEYETDEEGRDKIYTRYKWDEVEEDWQVDVKAYYQYPNESESIIKEYQYSIDGYNPAFDKNYMTILNYNDSIGKYTGIDDGMGYVTQITYNENLKVDEMIQWEDGEIYDKVKCYYDISGRDSLWMDYYYSSWRKDTVIYYVKFSYSEISSNEWEITELHYDNLPDTIYDDYGNIIGTSSDAMIKSIISDERIIQSSGYEKSGNNWIVEDSMIFTYNINGQIETILYESEYYKSRTDYVFSNDTLTLNEYSKEGGIETAEWELYNKTVYKVDSSVGKDQFQQLPAVLFEADEGKTYSYEWHLQFDYGKILEVIDYSDYDEPGNFEINYKSILYYSPASALQGEGYISGYIYDESGENKSITITTNGTGEPLEGVSVSLCAKEDDFVLATDTTDSEGFYEFKGVPKGNFYIKVEWQDYEQSSTHEMEVTTDSKTFEEKNFIIQDGKVITNIEEWKRHIKVYPNPTDGKINITGLTHLVDINIYNINSQLIKSFQQVNSTIDISELNTGVYIMKVTSKNKTVVRKVIKK